MGEMERALDASSARARLHNDVKLLRERVSGLEKIVIGQSGMIALLTVLLVKNGTLSQEDAVLVPIAARDMQQREMTAEEAAKWSRRMVSGACSSSTERPTETSPGDPSRH